MGILIQFPKTVKLAVRWPDDDEQVTYCAAANSRRVAEAVACGPLPRPLGGGRVTVRANIDVSWWRETAVLTLRAGDTVCIAKG